MAKADSAVRSLAELAADTSRPLTCASIASAQGIPFRFLTSVFRDLRAAGLVRSQRGCEGGYWIGGDPADITVAEVMAAVDGDLFTVRGERPDELGARGAARGVGELWQRLASQVDALLRATTLTDLAAHRVAADPADPADPVRDAGDGVTG